ncbi:MAG: hypothetical protein WCB92_33595, partial [Mycobacterium sp.]
QAVRPDWAGAGIRLNALAPGAVMTPLLEEQLASPHQSKAVRRRSVRPALTGPRRRPPPECRRQ